MKSDVIAKQTITEIVVNFADGNYGAVTAIMELLTNNEDSNAYLVLETLKSNDIKGPYLYVLWNDHADRNIKKFKQLVMATYGKITRARLKELSNEREYGKGLTEDEKKVIFTNE